MTSRDELIEQAVDIIRSHSAWDVDGDGHACAECGYWAAGDTGRSYHPAEVLADAGLPVAPNDTEPTWGCGCGCGPEGGSDVVERMATAIADTAELAGYVICDVDAAAIARAALRAMAGGSDE